MDSIFLHIENSSHDGAFGNNPIPTPTDAQCQAGNYKLGRVNLYGLEIAIEQPRGTYRTGIDSKTGKPWSSRMAAHYGYFYGTKGNDGDGMDCFVGFYPQSDTVYVINQNVGGKFDEHKTMLAFPDEESARRAYQDSYERGWSGLESIIAVSISQLKWWLKHGDMSKPLRPANLPPKGLETMTKKVLWNSEALPYDQTIDQVLYDIRRADAGEGLLLDAVCANDIAEDSDGVLAFDALVTPYSHLERKMEVLNGVMGRTGQAVKPVSLQITEPFKQRGVANVAAIFELSDGQTVSIYFHNPDVNPNKMAGTDEVISWKWLLNKKDITIVVAPERGEDLNIREVARRIMKLAEKNSAAYRRANGKRTDRMAAISGLKEEVAGLEKELEKAQHDLDVAKQEAEDSAVPNHYSQIILNNLVESFGWEVSNPGVSVKKDVGGGTVGGELNPTGSRVVYGVFDAPRNRYLALQVGMDEIFNIDCRDRNTKEVAEEFDSRVRDWADSTAVKTAAPQTPDLSYRAKDDMFTSFLPNTPAGENAWRELAAQNGGDGNVLTANAEEVAQQLRDKGFTVTKSAAKTETFNEKESDALLAELSAPVSSGVVNYYDASDYVVEHFLGKKQSDVMVFSMIDGGKLLQAKAAKDTKSGIPRMTEQMSAEAAAQNPGSDVSVSVFRSGDNDTAAKLLVAKGFTIDYTPKQDQQAAAPKEDKSASEQPLIDAYIKAWGTEAEKINYAVSAVNWGGITDHISASTEEMKLRSAVSAAKDIIPARDALASVGIQAWDSRLANVTETPEFKAHGDAIAAYRAAEDRMRAVAKEKLIEAGTAELAALPADAPLADVATAIFRKYGIETAAGNPPQIVTAIEAKDAAMAWSILRNLDNKASASIFERSTGIKLAKTQRDRRQQIDAWAGITPEQRAEKDAAKDAAWQTSEIEKSVKNSWEWLKAMNVRDGAEVIDGQQYLLRQAADGYNEVGTSKKGAAVTYGLKKDSALRYVKNKNFNAFLKAAQAFGGLKQALDLVGAVILSVEVKTPVQIVDAAYQFASATDEFKEWMAESVDKAEYSPFVTAKAMDEAAKRNGASIEWGMFGGALDCVSGDEIFDAESEWEATPAVDEDGKECAATLDGDYKGHPFHGNQYRHSSRESGAAMHASGRAKHFEQKGDTKELAKAHKVAHLSHAAALMTSTTEKTRHYHKTMAEFHAKQAGMKSVLDSVADMDGEDFGYDESEIGGTFEAEDVALDSSTLDGIDQDGYVGKINKGGETVGRVDIGDDGKAMVFVGAEGDRRVVFASGVLAMYSDSDGADMVEAIFTVTQGAVNSSEKIAAPVVSPYEANSGMKCNFE